MTRLGDTAALARHRVLDYFSAVGLPPSAPLTAVADAMVAQVTAGGTDDLVRRAVAAAQGAVELFVSAVFADGPNGADPGRRRSMLAASGHFFPDNVEQAKALAASWEDRQAAQDSLYEHFRAQTFAGARPPRWLIGLILPLTLTAVAAVLFGYHLAAGGLLAVELIWLLLFLFAFWLSAIGLCTALYGFALGFRRPGTPSNGTTTLPRTAVLIPIYHEDPNQVFGAVIAMAEALGRQSAAAEFECFVLSDSQDPVKIAAERRAVHWARQTAGPTIPIFYRRRSRNVGKKSGNLAEFFEHWSGRYEYVVVLDADSLMRADAMVEMVRRIHAEPGLGLLQAPLEVHHARTLFARANQFVGAAVGALFTRGLAGWAGDDGNYYGHNAVIRVKAFLECCALPVLQGRPPFGGHILSHDFVEAALLCRAGWGVRIAHDISGSWEEYPPTLPQYVKRDRRWCQGEMQHLRILFIEGLHPMSRLHLFVGVSSYLAAPVWLLFLLIGLVASAAGSVSPVPIWVWSTLLVATLVALLAPRLLGWISVITDPVRCATYDGAIRLTLSFIVEALLAALLAPLLMVHRTRSVLSALLGRTVQWGPQRRRASDTRREIATEEIPATLLGAGLLALILWVAPDVLWWLSPVWIPLLLAVPLALVASSVGAGQLLARARLLTVPAESRPDPMDIRAETLRAQGIEQDSWQQFRDIVLDPLLLDAHCAALKNANNGNGGSEAPEAVRERARVSGPAELSAEDRLQLAADPASLRWLHGHAWRSWPIESWDPVAPPMATPA